ncbi:MAG: DUF2723 domain-containing protein [Anaerolineae bacterium]|nr:DUF2723 domain-containing protein [Anaerolineae bacterium]
MMKWLFSKRAALAFLLVLLVLIPLYLTTLQTIPNGAEHYYMIDVGETQIVLNTWGTLHATGYPLYVILGNLIVTVLRVVGVSAATAPGLVSLLWTVLALGGIFLVLSRQFSVSSFQFPVSSGKPSAVSGQQSASRISAVLISVGVVILFGLTRTVWIHAAIAEIYSFGLLILVILLGLALWPQEPPPNLPRTQGRRNRLYWLALIGGIGVFHHRAILMAAPALVYAVWGEFFSSQLDAKNHQLFETVDHQKPKIKNLVLSTQYSILIKRILICLLIGLVGFLPYLYLPARAEAAWVYGEPGTWDGFWDQFLGREASRFIGAPTTSEGLTANFNLVNTVLVTDLTAPGIIAGLAGLLLALRKHRRAAIMLLLSGGVAYIFHVLLYTDVLSALILPITLSLAFGWGFLAEVVIGYRFTVISYQSSIFRLPIKAIAVLGLMGVFGVVLIGQNYGFIRELTNDQTGLETITLAEGAPPGSTLMLDWGPRHFAVGFARDVLGELPNIRLVSHKADFKNLVTQGALVTPEYTFYNRPVSWWEAQIGATIYLHATAPRLVQITTEREIAGNPPETGIVALEQSVLCTPEAIDLYVSWVAAEQPAQNLSVFVHLLDANGGLIGQGDQSAPVYGWRPVTSWQAGEIVRDVYPLPRTAGAAQISFGLYRALDGGGFENVYTFETAVNCDG